MEDIDSTKEIKSMAAKSQIFSYIPLMGAFSALQKLLNPSGVPLQWNSSNSFQEEFLQMLARHGESVGDVAGLQSIAHYDIQKVNEWVEQHGFSIRLKDIPPQPGIIPFATASVLDIQVEWPIPAEVQVIELAGRSYPAFLNKGLTYHEMVGHPYPILSLFTKDPRIKVCIAIVDDAPQSELHAYAMATHMLKHKQETLNTRYAGAIIPMVSLSQENDISWLKGLCGYCDNGDIAELKEALQQSRFRMNEHGARAESAAAVSGIRYRCIEEFYVVNQSFLIWWEQEGIPIPTFTGYIMLEHWANPGDISQPF